MVTESNTRLLLSHINIVCCVAMHEYFHAPKTSTPPSKDWWTAFWRSASAWRWWPPGPTLPHPLTGCRVFCSSCGSGQCDLGILPQTPWPHCRPPAAEQKEGTNLRGRLNSTASLDFKYSSQTEADIRLVLTLWSVDWRNEQCCKTKRYITKDCLLPLLIELLLIVFEPYCPPSQ